MGTFCLSGQVIAKAGANRSTAIPNEYYVTWISGAESYINDETRFNWTANYSTLSGAHKYLLGDVCSSLAAIPVINYDMSGYTSKSEAETMLDVNRDIANKGITTLKEIKVQEFLT